MSMMIMITGDIKEEKKRSRMDAVVVVVYISVFFCMISINRAGWGYISKPSDLRYPLSPLQLELNHEKSCEWYVPDVIKTGVPDNVIAKRPLSSNLKLHVDSVFGEWRRLTVSCMWKTVFKPEVSICMNCQLSAATKKPTISGQIDTKPNQLQFPEKPFPCAMFEKFVSSG